MSGLATRAKLVGAELQLSHRCFDTWRGVGDVVTGMKHQGYEVSVGDHGAAQSIAVFYAGHGGRQAFEAAGTAHGSTPWRATQHVAWDGLTKAEQVFDHDAVVQL